jgi:RND family efflux transporter MFP subunit
MSIPRSAWLLPALVLAYSLAHAAPGSDLIRISLEQQRAAGVESAPVAARQSRTLQGLPAQVSVPNTQMRVVSTPLAGLVESLFVATHQAVKRGQVVARLQSPDLADVQHTYLQATSQYQLAKAAAERDEQLFGAGVIPKSRLEASQSRLQEASADVAERYQALRATGMSDAAIQRLRAGQGGVGSTVELTAPIDGIVLEQQAVAGQRLEASAPVMTVARLQPLWIEIQVPADRIAGIAVGALASVPAANAQGRVISIGRSVSSSTQTVGVRAEIREGTDRLRPGQLVEATLSATAGPALWQVPAGALARVGGKTLVYVARPEGFLPVAVEVVEQGPDTALVSGPLKRDERLAVRGVSTLKAMQTGVGGNG